MITLLILLIAIKNKFSDLKEQAQDDDTKFKTETGATTVSMLGIIDPASLGNLILKSHAFLHPKLNM